MKITTNNDNLSDDEDKENKTNSQISEKEELDPYLNNEGNYVNNIILGISDIKNHKYGEALLKFQEAYKISELINDDYKKKESQCHIGIAKFMTGDSEGLELLENLYNEYIEEINNTNNHDIDSINLILFSKIGSNLILFYLKQNNLEDCIEIINTIMELIDNQKENTIKLNIIKNINYILFRTPSLILTKSISFNSNNNDNFITFKEEIDNNLMIKKSIHNLFQEFNNYLKTNNLESLFQCISLTEEAFKKVEDYNGLIFVIFLQQIIIYNKKCNEEDKDMIDRSQDDKKDSHVKIITLIQTINGQSNFNNNLEDDIDNYINEFKSKIEISVKLYEILYKNEQKISELIEEENNIRNKIDEDNDNINKKISEQESFKKILINILNRTISEIDNLQNDVIKIQINSQIQQTLTILENKDLYISEKVMEPFKNIINNTIKKKFNDNLSLIYNRIQKKIYFKLFHKNIAKEIDSKHNEEIKDFYDLCYLKIIDGNSLLKLNMGNNGIKEHFYKVNYDKAEIEIYNKSGSFQPDKCIKITQIRKITIGLQSQNFHSKLNYIPISKEPWKGISFICKLRSLDLIFKKEDIAKKWFYGLQHYLKNILLSYKINSTTGYIIQKLKMKIMKKTKNKKDIKKNTFLKAILKYCNDNNI